VHVTRGGESLTHGGSGGGLGFRVQGLESLTHGGSGGSLSHYAQGWHRDMGIAKV
jgi:hypothetical protein